MAGPEPTGFVHSPGKLGVGYTCKGGIPRFFGVSEPMLSSGIVIGLLLATGIAAAALAAEPAPAVAEPAAHSLFDGESLGDWKPTPFGGEGEVTVADGVIRIARGSDLSGITWQGKFPIQGYEIALDARRMDGHDFFCGLTFPVADSHCSLILGGWGGGLVGLSSIDGNDAANNATTQIMSFEARRWYAVRVRVSPERIECFLDGKRIIDQPLDGHSVSIRSEISPSLPLGIATYATEAEVRGITWQPLAGDEPHHE
jgi:hypothetical protein